MIYNAQATVLVCTCIAYFIDSNAIKVVGIDPKTDTDTRGVPRIGSTVLSVGDMNH